MKYIIIIIILLVNYLFSLKGYKVAQFVSLLIF